MKLTGEFCESLYSTMVQIRRFDEKVAELFQAGHRQGHRPQLRRARRRSPPAPARICARTTSSSSNHRGHGHCIAKGARIDRMMAELMGREDRLLPGPGRLDAHRRPRPQHPRVRTASSARACRIGAGRGARRQDAGQRPGGDRVLRRRRRQPGHLPRDPEPRRGLEAARSSSSARTTSTRLTTDTKRTTAGRSIAKRAPGLRHARRARSTATTCSPCTRRSGRRWPARARGEGPSLIEAMTWRWGGHSMRANLPDYRTKEEEREWIERDPIARVRSARLVEHEGPDADASSRSSSRRSSGARRARCAFANGQPRAEPWRCWRRGLRAARGRARSRSARGTRELTIAEALNEAMAPGDGPRPARLRHGRGRRADRRHLPGHQGPARALRRASACATRRSRRRPSAGPASARRSPGMRPVVEIQIFDFIALTMDQIVNQAAKFRYMLGGTPDRAAGDPRARRAAASASPPSTRRASKRGSPTCPGWSWSRPRRAYDAKGLLTAAIRDDNPVIFLEHKLLVPRPGGAGAGGAVCDPARQGRRSSAPGKDVTVVATQMMVGQALQAATRLETDGIERRGDRPAHAGAARPTTIVESVRRTNRLVVVARGLEARRLRRPRSRPSVTEAAFDWLDAPVARVGARDVPMPYNDRLERATIPVQGRHRRRNQVASLAGQALPLTFAGPTAGTSKSGPDPGF